MTDEQIEAACRAWFNAERDGKRIATLRAELAEAKKEVTEAMRQKDICRIESLKLRDMLEASKNGHWYGRMITAETQNVDLKKERDEARAEVERMKARTVTFPPVDLGFITCEYSTGFSDAIDHAKSCIRAAGITIEGEQT